MTMKMPYRYSETQQSHLNHMLNCKER